MFPEDTITMARRFWIYTCTFVLVIAASAAVAQDMPSQMKAKDTPAMEMHHGVRSTIPLRITFGDKSAQWTQAQLAALPHTSITVYNEHAKATQTYSGVPLASLLATLGVPAKPRGKDFRLYLVAEGSDGYQVVYSLGEVTPDVHDGAVLVADQVDGKPLGDNGDFQLVAAGERRPARWVRNLVTIRVLTAN